jgi:FKBP12-rapamycin complex-associated protein
LFADENRRLGTYKAKSEVIRIRSFSPIVKVIPSKQQPRKIVIHGTNGVNYPFLLKGMPYYS